jgi:(2Fe-2S) ferredoxin
VSTEEARRSGVIQLDRVVTGSEFVARHHRSFRKITMAIKDLTKCERHIFLCSGSSCTENGATELIHTIREEIRLQGLHDCIHTTKTLCNGRCDDGPIVIIQPDGIWYRHVGANKAQRIVDEHLKNDRPIADLVLYRWGHSTLEDE